jgi:hypothetical protein
MLLVVSVSFFCSWTSARAWRVCDEHTANHETPATWDDTVSALQKGRCVSLVLWYAAGVATPLRLSLHAVLSAARSFPSLLLLLLLQSSRN